MPARHQQSTSNKQSTMTIQSSSADEAYRRLVAGIEAISHLHLAIPSVREARGKEIEGREEGRDAFGFGVIDARPDRPTRTDL